MPRKKAKPDFPATVADALAPIAEKYDLKPASQALQQLPPPEPELQPLKQLTDAREAKALIDTPSQPEPEKPKGPGDTEIAPSPERNGKHSDKVKPKEPRHSVPDGFINVDSYPEAGVKVNKSLDRGTFAIQFAADRLPSVEEKDLLAAKEIKYHPARKQWERTDPENPGANGLDAKRVGQEIAEDRVGRVR